MTHRLCKSVFRLSLCSRRFFTEGIPQSRTHTQHINSILMKLDNDVKDDKEMEYLSVMNSLQSVSEKWPELAEQELLGSVIFGMRHRDHYEDINHIARIVLEKKCDVASGLVLKFLKSYIGQRNWTPALLWVDHLKTITKLNHIRFYNDIIQALAKDHLFTLSFKYFVEVQKEEISIKVDKMELLEDITLKELLHCALRLKKEPNLLDHSDRYVEVLPVVETKAVLNSVIGYIHNQKFPISSDLLALIVELFSQEHNVKVTRTMQLNELCASCYANLQYTPDFSQMCSKIVSNFKECMIQVQSLKQLGYLDDVLREHGGGFDFIVDTANVIGGGNNPKGLPNLLRSLARLKPRNVALVYKPFLSGLANQSWTELNLNFSIVNVLLEETEYASSDDACLIYLAAKSEVAFNNTCKNMTIISADNYRDHRYLSDDQVHMFTNWLRYRQCGCDISGGISKKKTFQEPVILSEDGSLHFVTKYEVCCIKPKMGKKL